MDLEKWVDDLKRYWRMEQVWLSPKVLCMHGSHVDTFFSSLFCTFLSFSQSRGNKKTSQSTKWLRWWNQKKKRKRKKKKMWSVIKFSACVVVAERFFPKWHDEKDGWQKSLFLVQRAGLIEFVTNQWSQNSSLNCNFLNERNPESHARKFSKKSEQWNLWDFFSIWFMLLGRGDVGFFFFCLHIYPIP